MIFFQLFIIIVQQQAVADNTGPPGKKCMSKKSRNMAEVAKEEGVKPCCNPGCDQPGTKSCSACKTSYYCSVICQTAHWSHHKEECDGHLRKVGQANLDKAKSFDRENNYVQTLRYGEIATTKLKLLKDRRLETVQAINRALRYKFDSLQLLGRHKEAHECIKECYTLWAMNHLRNPGSMTAALAFIESCIHNKEFEDAERYARHAYFMIAEMTDNFIPSDQYPQFLADVSFELARAIHRLAKANGIPPAEKQKAGEEAIALARKALEIHTQLHGREHNKVAADLLTLAEILAYFNNSDDDDIPLLYQESIAIYRRVEENSSVNVGVCERSFALFYLIRANNARSANEVDRELADLEQALTHFIETARICKIVDRVEKAEQATEGIILIEERIRQIEIAKAAAEAAAAATSRG